MKQHKIQTQEIAHAKSDLSEHDLFAMLETARKEQGLYHNCMNDILQIISEDTVSTDKIRKILTTINGMRYHLGTIQTIQSLFGDAAKL